MEPRNKQIHKPEYKIFAYVPKGDPSRGWQSTSFTSTIPTKYQTVVCDISEKKGFGSRAKRFDDDLNQRENPGPGTYDYTHVPLESFSTSFSKRGMGGLASKAPRTERRRAIHTPGANAYSIPSTILSKMDYHLGNSSMFHPPIAMKVDSSKNRTPGPSEYDISNVFLGKVNNMSAESAFLSKSRRVTDPQRGLIGPSPCQYRINHSLTRESPKAIISSFKSKTMRLQHPTESRSPGPATYQPYKSMTEARTHFAYLHPWKKHYMCISAPPFPMNRDPTPPGPGYYEVANFHDPPKHYMTSAAFVSNTSRWTGNVQDKDIPGPASYVPKKKEKHSFLYNVNRKWVPL